MKYIQKPIEPENLFDYKQIEIQLSLYCLAMDNKDDELCRSLFTKDARADFAPLFSGHISDFIDFSMNIQRSKVSTRHQVSEVLISFYGDRAVSIADSRSTLIAKEDEDWHVWDAYGKYQDDWINVNGRWLISRRTYRRDFAIVTQPEKVVEGYSL